MNSLCGLISRTDRLTIVGSILFASDHCLGVKEGSVRTGFDLVDGTGLQINVKGTGNMFTRTSFGEKGGETQIMVRVGVCDTTVGLEVELQRVLEGRGGTTYVQTVFQSVELPWRVVSFSWWLIIS